MDILYNIGNRETVILSSAKDLGVGQFKFGFKGYSRVSRETDNIR